MTITYQITKDVNLIVQDLLLDGNVLEETILSLTIVARFVGMDFELDLRFVMIGMQMMEKDACQIVQEK